MIIIKPAPWTNFEWVTNLLTSLEKEISGENL